MGFPYPSKHLLVVVMAVIQQVQCPIKDLAIVPSPYGLHPARVEVVSASVFMSALRRLYF